MGNVSESSRIRALEGLLDKAGKCKVMTLQAAADARGTPLTVQEVKGHLDAMFETSGAQDAKIELKSLIPDWSGGRPAGPAWRRFAEEFRMLSALAPEIADDEKREHLLVNCLTQQLATHIMNEDRRRAKKPKVILSGFGNIPPGVVRSWLATQGVETNKGMPATGGGHIVTCESITDFNAIAALDRCHVEVAGTIQPLSVRRVDTKMSIAEILDAITEKLADEEVYNDTRRMAAQAHQAPLQQQPHYRRRVQMVETTDGTMEDLGYEPDDFQAQVAAVEQRAPGSTQGSRGQQARPSSSSGPVQANTAGGRGDGGKGKGKGDGKGFGGRGPAGPNLSQSSSSGPPSGKGKGDHGKGSAGGKGEQAVEGGKGYPRNWSPLRPWCKQCGGDHMTVLCPDIDCWHCGGVGHTAARCPQLGCSGKGASGRPAAPRQ
jgi:hypothetical protein